MKRIAIILSFSVAALVSTVDAWTCKDNFNLCIQLSRPNTDDTF